MTLRARLTAAFLAVVLGPVLIGAIFVGSTTTGVARQRSIDRLTLGGDAVRTSVDALCRRLSAAAATVAVAVTNTGAGTGQSTAGAAATGQPTAGADRAAQLMVDQGLADLIRTRRTVDAAWRTTGAVATPWADCAAPAASGAGSAGPPTRYRGIVARVDLRDPDGSPAGHVEAAAVVDAALLRAFSAAAGVSVTLLDQTGAPGVSTDAPDAATAAVAAVRGRGGVEITAAPDRRYAQALETGPGQPLPLVLAIRYHSVQGLYLLLLGVLIVTGAFAVAMAWWLAGSTTRPLAELAAAVERVATGDLSARVPVRGRDEISRLAAAVNWMARETQAYVEALTASRDQFRDRLGVLGATLSSTHNPQEILRVIVRSAMTVTGAAAGMVMIVDPDQDVLVGRCGEGLIERGQPDPMRLRVLVGDGLLGAVAASGEPRRGRIGRDGPKLSPHEPRCRTYLAVPFSAPPSRPPAVRPADRTARAGRPGEPRHPDGPGRRDGSEHPDGYVEAAAPGSPVRGVLVLYDRLGGDEFDDGDLVTLTSFASQAAIAVQNVRVHEETRRQSLTDPLTGLRNYRFLTEQVRTEVERAIRSKLPLCVLALDLDRFKEVNDTFGHAAGDAVLIEFARRIRAEIREVDAAFRQGGEEFVILLPDTDLTGGAIVAERLGTAIRSAPMVITRPRSAAGVPVQHIPVTVSIGVAVFPVHAADANRLLEAADTALYAAKAAGRDTFRVATAGTDAGTAGADAGTAGAETVTAAVEAGTAGVESVTVAADAGGGRAVPAGRPPAAARSRPRRPRKAGSAANGTTSTPVPGAEAEPEPEPQVSDGAPRKRRSKAAPSGGESDSVHPPRQSRGR